MGESTEGVSVGVLGVAVLGVVGAGATAARRLGAGGVGGRRGWADGGAAVGCWADGDDVRTAFAVRRGGWVLGCNAKYSAIEVDGAEVMATRGVWRVRRMCFT